MATLEETDSLKWVDREKHWIKTFLDLGANLVNHTEGGEGTYGHTHSPESKQKMSEAAKRRPANRKGQTNSEAHRKAISEAKKGKSVNHLLDPDVQKRSAESRRGRKVSDETKRKISETLKAKKSSSPTSI